MSFLKSLARAATKALGSVWQPESKAGAFAKSAVMGFINDKLNRNVNPGNSIRPPQPTFNLPSFSPQPSGTTATQAAPVDPGVEVRVDPDPNYSVPVLYGQAFVRGAVTDAAISADQLTMFYCITLCEKTGAIKSRETVDEFGDPVEVDSTIFCDEVYWNGNKIRFSPQDGVTAQVFLTPEGSAISGINSLRVYFYNNGGDSPQRVGFTPFYNTRSAYERMQGWSATDTMDGLVFAIVQIDYDPENEITGLGDLQFNLRNTLYKPGDVMYDYMTNTRYGAGIPEAEIDF